MLRFIGQMQKVTFQNISQSVFGAKGGMFIRLMTFVFPDVFYQEQES